MRIVVKSQLPENPNSNDVIELILKNRNLTLEQRAESREHSQKETNDKLITSTSTRNSELGTRNFFSPPSPTTLSLSDFGFEKEYVENAMKLIWSFHDQEKPIIVYSDYDADGVTGGAVLWETLHNLGFKAFPYIGSRIEEGYGFSKTGLDAVKKKYDPSLIMSVDHGIAAKDMVRYAKYELNIPIIVTDHHHRQEDKVPTDAEYIFHIPALSGSGTAYYVAKEVVGYRLKVVDENKANKHISTTYELPTTTLDQLFATDYIGLAAIGTIADLVPLVGPSRAIAKYGLEALTKTTRPGIVALKEVAGNLGKKITTYEVGFMIAPRINASGRLADALSALRLLCTKDKKKADDIASRLQALNIERQDMVKKAVEEAIKIVEDMKDSEGNLPKILIIYQKLDQRNNESNSYELTANSSFWHEGIIGLIASKIVEKYHRPTIVLTTQGHRDQVVGGSEDSQNRISITYNLQPTTSSYKASARSIPGFHLTDFLKNFAEYLAHFGGHAAAAGLSISGANLPIFIEKATALAEGLISDEMLLPTMEADCELSLDLASIDLAKKIESLEPFGVGNEKPRFVISGKVENVQVFGKENNHLRFRLRDNNNSLDFIAFGKADMAESLTKDSNQRLAYQLELNYWNGNVKLQAKLITKY
ncbi:MAG: DHHA1 domain-containing protein [Patescibacteria group bacterium]